MRPTVIILSISSDIGAYLAQEYLRQGYRVIGTYRHLPPNTFKKSVNCLLYPLDIHVPLSVKRFIAKLKDQGIKWDTVISCVGEPRPLQAFFKADLNQWAASVEINSVDQLKVIHGLYPLRVKKSNVVFFAAGGTNNAVIDFSAYTIGKIMLMKMCEFLDAENPDMNVFIVGPGWTNTKIQGLIANDPKAGKARRQETLAKLKANQGTPLGDIFTYIEWLCRAGKAVAGGRNFSVVYDPWKKGNGYALKQALLKDQGMYKLKRHRNDFSLMEKA